MAFISTIAVAEATGEVRAMYEQAQARMGYVPNYTKLFSLHPEVYAAWSNLLGNIRSHMDPRRYELVTLAAARAMRSSYCLLAHGAILRQQFYSADHLASIARQPTTADLDPADLVMLDFADRITRDAASISEAEVQKMRDYGFNDGEIFDIAAAAAARCFFSKLLDALGAEPDSAYLQLDDQLQEQLTPGRAIGRAPVEQLPEAR
jgi:uncharacterized peroxidase-related enzyme